jgi:putative endonuclease
MKYCCYILYSKTLDKYYIGETEDIEKRMVLHNSAFFGGSYTSRSDDWTIYLTIECISRQQAREIESHIKSMKSRAYIESLKRLPRKTEKLKKKYE